MSKKILLVVLVTLFLVSSARAYLGEWVDDIREKTGSMLDRIKAPQVFSGTSTDPLPVKRKKTTWRLRLRDTPICV
jgi:hypothetical protein